MFLRVPSRCAVERPTEQNFPHSAVSTGELVDPMRRRRDRDTHHITKTVTHEKENRSVSQSQCVTCSRRHNHPHTPLRAHFPDTHGHMHACAPDIIPTQLHIAQVFQNQAFLFPRVSVNVVSGPGVQMPRTVIVFHLLWTRCSCLMALSRRPAENTTLVELDRAFWQPRSGRQMERWVVVRVVAAAYCRKRGDASWLASRWNELQSCSWSWEHYYWLGAAFALGEVGVTLCWLFKRLTMPRAARSQRSTRRCRK